MAGPAKMSQPGPAGPTQMPWPLVHLLPIHIVFELRSGAKAHVRCDQAQLNDVLQSTAILTRGLSVNLPSTLACFTAFHPCRRTAKQATATTTTTTAAAARVTKRSQQPAATTATATTTAATTNTHLPIEICFTRVMFEQP